MNVLITGGAGFIGGHTARALVGKGYRGVRVLDILDPQIHGERSVFPDYMDSRVECRYGDVRNPDDVNSALEGMDCVIHLAALTGVGQSMYDLRNYSDVNVTGTASLLEAIVKRKRPLKRLVLASSRAVYGEGTAHCAEHGYLHPDLRRREDLEAGKFEVFCPLCGRVLDPAPTREDRPLKPISVYAWTKAQQEHLCQYAARTFDLPVTILRYFNVYGPHQSLRNPYTGVAAIFFSRIQAGKPVSVYEHNKPIRDMVYVDDVVQANLLALETDVAAGTVINVGAGNRHTIADVAGALGVMLGKKVDLLDTVEFRVGDILQCYADLERASRLLGYAPRYTLQEGMKLFVAWASQQESVDLYQKTVDELNAFNLFGRACEQH